MKGIKYHNHQERNEIVRKLIPIIQDQLGDNLIALGAGGSFARNADRDYSDIELVAFVREPLKEYWEIRKIINGMLVVVVADTKEDYIRKYLDISDIWYASGAEKMVPLLNENLIHELNNYQPVGVEKKSLQQITKKWSNCQEITAKTLNIIKESNIDAFPVVLNQMIKDLCIILSYLNQTPFITLGSYVTQSKQFAVKPLHFNELIELNIKGQYQELSKFGILIEQVFSELEDIVEGKGLRLYADIL